MYRNSLLSALLLALAVQSVRGKPACCCPCTNTIAPCSNPPTTSTSPPAKSNCVNPLTTSRQPCSANPEIRCVPCSAPDQSRTPKPCDVQKNNTPSTTTTTTTTTTERPRTTTTLPPSTTASPKSNCANGEIYPSNTGSCDQFLMCRDQIYVLMVCPPGFGFNHQMKSCDWSANVPACSARQL